MDIPYTTEVRPDTGLYNGKLGMWLFLASEVMLFAGLFSGYVFLRTATPGWPHGPDLLDVRLATLNTVILITSSMTMVVAWASLKTGNFPGFRRYLGITFVLGLIFLAIKFFEYNDKFSHGHYPSTNNFYAIYFVLTGIHFLHIAAGLVAMLYHLALGSRMWKTNNEQFTNRIEVTGLYWHFVDFVWIFLFPSLYLI